MDFSIHNLCAGEITTMLSTNRSLEHEQHVYDFAFFVEIVISICTMYLLLCRLLLLFP